MKLEAFNRIVKTIEYFKKNKDRFISPTEIGCLFGGHSAIGSPICLKLVKLGRLERNGKGHYKFIN